MKTIGMIAGMSWESSLEYYRLVNQGVKARLGGLHSAKCVMVSVDFAEIEVLQREGRWQEAAQHWQDAVYAALGRGRRERYRMSLRYCELRAEGVNEEEANRLASQ